MRHVVLTRIAFLAAIVTATRLPQAAAGAAPSLASVGRPAPRFVLESASGAQVTLATFAGKPLVLNVFASWCPPCRSELPRIAKAARGANGRIAFVGVDEQEPAEIANRFAREMRLPYPIAFDHGQFSATYAVPSLPATIFIDRRGIVRAIYRGTIDEGTLARDLALIAT